MQERSTLKCADCGSDEDRKYMEMVDENKIVCMDCSSKYCMECGVPLDENSTELVGGSLCVDCG